MVLNGLAGVGLSMLDGGTMRRVQISNVSIDGAVAPIQVRLGNAGRGQAQPSPGLIENTLLKDITVRGATGNNLISGLTQRSLKKYYVSECTDGVRRSLQSVASDGRSAGARCGISSLPDLAWSARLWFVLQARGWAAAV